MGLMRRRPGFWTARIVAEECVGMGLIFVVGEHNATTRHEELKGVVGASMGLRWG
jgi:hypothetical protein